MADVTGSGRRDPPQGTWPAVAAVTRRHGKPYHERSTDSGGERPLSKPASVRPRPPCAQTIPWPNTAAVTGRDKPQRRQPYHGKTGHITGPLLAHARLKGAQERCIMGSAAGFTSDPAGSAAGRQWWARALMHGGPGQGAGSPLEGDDGLLAAGLRGCLAAPHVARPAEAPSRPAAHQNLGQAPAHLELETLLHCAGRPSRPASAAPPGLARPRR